MRLRTSGDAITSVWVASAPMQSRSPRSLDSPQRIEPPQVQEPRVLQRPEIERDVQIRAPRHRRQRPLAAQHLQRVAERLRFEERALRNRIRH